VEGEQGAAKGRAPQRGVEKQGAQPHGAVAPRRARLLPGADELTPAPDTGGPRRARAGLGVRQIAARLASDPELQARIVNWREVPARAPRFAPLPERLDPRLKALLAAAGKSELFVHQARAVELALAGRDVLVATPTASGKTIAYTLPVLQRLIESVESGSGRRSRSLWLFPTKALSQDQSSGLNRLLTGLAEAVPALGGVHSFTYDGDTPPSVRRTLRERGDVLLTNPWMLHSGILPNHAKWADLFRDLEFVVIDEVHTLAGVLGSSVANVLRRLVRIARFYGAEPRFLLSSATLRDPAGHARTLIGRPVEVVSEDGSPSAERLFAVYDPPLLDPIAGLRASAIEEARRLARHLVGPGHQTIFFCNRRTSVEVLTRYLKEGARELGLSPEEIRGYRGGYLPLLRREIEDGLRRGEVKVVVTTNALELGIDVGQLDVAVLVGYPGSQASFWQRVGRVGRRGQASLALLIARSDPLDQYLAQHPEYLFAAPRESLGLDPDNLVLLSEQLKCAAFELPFQEQRDAHGAVRVEGFGASPHLADILDYLADGAGLLHKREDPLRAPVAGRRPSTWYWMADAYPAQDVSLAGGEPDNVLVLDADTGKALGEVDRAGSIVTVHEGAIYQVEGETWKIERFDYKNRRAYARAVESDYFTDAQTETEVRVLRLEARRERRTAQGGEDLCLWRGEVHVTTLANLYKKIRFYTRENVGAEEIVLPPEELDSEACLLTLGPDAARRLELFAGSRGAGWSAVGGLLRRVAPLFLRCQPADLGLTCELKSPHFERPTITLYDRVQGGVGLCVQLFAAAEEIFGAAHAVVAGCPCRAGCPACVGPADEVGPLGKATARRILEHLLAGPLSEELAGEDLLAPGAAEPCEPAIHAAEQEPPPLPPLPAKRAAPRLLPGDRLP
jgi:DEAD/DEAH box helicase domain-containing protein